MKRGSAEWPGMALLAVLALLVACALTSPLWTGRPWSMALSSGGGLVAALLVAWAAMCLQRGGAGRVAFDAFCRALLVAGVLNTVIGLMQLYAPAWTGNDWIAASLSGDRAVGNLRQANHLCALLLWAIAGAVWLDSQGRLSRRTSGALIAFLLLGVVITASRSGTMGVLLFALWGALDRGLPRRLRGWLIASPVLYGLLFGLVSSVSGLLGVAFWGQARLQENDVSNSRGSLWAEALALVRENPWTGVGFGEFNFAWTLHEFPNRSPDYFSVAHNLPLHFAAELGIPLALVLVALLGWALWRAVGLARGGEPSQLGARRAGLVMLLLMAVFSLIEIHLWFAHLLLPTVFLFGLLVTPDGAPADAAAPRPEPPPLLPVGLVATLVLSVASLYQFSRVLPIFGMIREVELAQRIETASRSWFFSHWADFARVNTAPDSRRLAPTASAHAVLEARLLHAWAIALAQRGETDKARFIAARLKEFRKPEYEAFFAVCAQPPAADGGRPFQCEAPQRRYSYRDFR
ncbi:polymerase [Piscinibacter aquaticus]|uniref:Polymerase n=1 Tax=Piscinibacter aquaticus TaxID=392597 RepID=A0A5C6U2A8_9BURK|nr:polymerase [Piscinibacter aquaticus]